MGSTEGILHWIDVALLLGGAVVVVAWVVYWVRRGADPLQGSPLRVHRLTLPAVWLCLLGYVGGSIIGVQIAPLLTPTQLGDEAAQAWQSIVAANSSQVFVILVCLAVAHVCFARGLRGFGLDLESFGRKVLWAVAGWVAVLFICTLTVWVTEWAIELLSPGYEPPRHMVFDTLEQSGVTLGMRLLTILGALILAPLGEEVFFRGILQSAVRKLLPAKWHSRRHRWFAIVLIGLVFGLVHFPTPHHVPALIAMGFILGYLYERTGSLWVPILLHAMFNGKTLLWAGIMERL